MSNKFNEDAKGIKSFKNTVSENHKSKKIIFLPIALGTIIMLVILNVLNFEHDADSSMEYSSIEKTTNNTTDIRTETNNVVVNKTDDNTIPTTLSSTIILSEEATTTEDNQPVQHISDFKSHVTNITSSSHLANETYGNKTYIYSAEKAFDNDMSTCWSEGADGYGVGESITVSFDDVYEISELSLWNGLCTSEDLFYKNSRLHNITVTLLNGNSYDFECSGGWDSRHNSFSFGGNIETSSITITIQSVYEGDKYKDTCISEISVS